MAASNFTNIEIVNIADSQRALIKRENWPCQTDNIMLEEIDNKFMKTSKSDEFILNELNPKKRIVWMINSTAQGGGVAEMLPMLISLFGEINITIKWLVISPPAKYANKFFDLTKQMHNNIHGVFNESTMVKLGKEQKELLENVCGDCCKEFTPLISKDDIIVIHDPQPMAMVKFIRQFNKNQVIIWRSHIGTDWENQTTKDTWNFLKEFISMFDHIIYSMKEYVPSCIKELNIKTTIVSPALSPFNEKNINLKPYEMFSLLSDAGIIFNEEVESKLAENEWKYKVQRVDSKSGKIVTCATKDNSNYEILFNPIMCEISRWDALKGWIELIKAFVIVKTDQNLKNNDFVQNLKLILAGPDPAFIQDDPEGVKVFKDLIDFYINLKEDKLKKDIYILSLPMNNKKENALIVNLLQNISSIMIQNSIQEGFGLTVTEAMWKGTPMIASNVGGIKKQVIDKKNGILIKNPNDPKSVAEAIIDMIVTNNKKMKIFGLEGKKHVLNNFLYWTQCQTYIDIFKDALKSKK